MINPLISIIIPAYNTRAKYLRQAISSVVSQTYLNWELIIVDDGSTRQETLDEFQFIEELKRSDVMIIRQENRKISGALNAGIRNMHGTWWAGLSSDDKWHPEKLAKQVEFIEKYPEAQVLYTDWEFIDRNGGRIKEYIEPEFASRKEAQKYIINDHIGNWSSMMIHRKVFDTIGLFNEDYPTREDYEMNIRILNHFRMHKVPGIWVQYRLHAEQITGSAEFGSGSASGKKYCQMAKDLAKRLYKENKERLQH